MEYPVAERIPYNVNFSDGKDFSKVKKDYYYWLRDDDRKDQKVLSYLKDENKYAENIMLSSGMMVKKNKIFTELKTLMVENYETVKMPIGENGFESEYRFFKSYKKGNSYPIYCYEKDDKKVEYFNPNKLPKKKSTLNVTDPFFDPQLNIFGYGVDYNGSEKYEIILKKFPSLEEIKHKIPPLLYCSIIIGNDKKIFYLKEDETNRLCKVMEYILESECERCLYEEKNVLYDVELRQGEDYRSIIYSSVSFTESNGFIEWYDNRDFKGYYDNSLVKGKEIELKTDGIFVFNKTNSNRSLNNRITYCKIFRGKEMVLVKNSAKVYIEDFYLVKKGLCMMCREKGAQFIRFIGFEKDGIELKITETWDIQYDGGYFLEMEYVDLESRKIIYSYESFLIPKTYFEYDFDDKSQREIYRAKTKNIDLSKYKMERIFDKKMPIDLLMLKDFEKNGTSNCLLYGYGSYGMNTDIKFDEKLFPLIDNGFVYAVAHIRGSSYMGKKYYDDGKMLNKMNTFNDFIAASEYLIKHKYCSPDKLSIEGRSAGGLLVTAVAMMKPNLYRNVVAGVPFVDVLVTMSDSTIPLTTHEWLQWGNPNEKEFYEYISQYSPIDNIVNGKNYPNFLITSGLYDPRVAYWEPAKFVATLRYNGVDDKNTIILKTKMDSGHFGSKDRYRYLEEVAERYAFLLTF